MKERFVEIYQKNITRPGAENLLAWLNRTDFFEAPASTRFHLSQPGGLVEHSIHVYERLRELYIREMTNKDYPGEYHLSPKQEEAMAVCGLLHDVCKANFYSVEMRNRKNEQGQWEKYPFYVVNDQLPYGHGEKSVYVISGFMKLSREEAMAIRWHMGFSDNEFKAGGYSVGNAFAMFPLALLTHIADLQATYLDEVEEETKNENAE
jgi:hypothetical protein